MLHRPFNVIIISTVNQLSTTCSTSTTLVQPSGICSQLASATTVQGDVQLTVAVMEDYERVLHFYSRGLSCMRCDFLSVKSDNKGRGGCASAFIDYSVEAQKEKDEKAPGS